MPLKDCLTKHKGFKSDEIAYFTKKHEEYVNKGMSDKEAAVRLLGESMDDVKKNMRSVYDQLGIDTPEADEAASEAVAQLSQRIGGLDPADIRAALRKNTDWDEKQIDALISGVPKETKQEVNERSVIETMTANKDNFKGPVGEAMAERLDNPDSHKDIVEMVKAQANEDPQTAADIYGQDVVDAALGKKKESKTTDNSKTQEAEGRQAPVLKQEEGAVRSESERTAFLDRLTRKDDGDFALFTTLPKDRKKQKLDAIASRIEKAFKDKVITENDYEILQDRLNKNYAGIGEDRVSETKVEKIPRPVMDETAPVVKMEAPKAEVQKPAPEKTEPAKAKSAKKPKPPKLTRQERINKLIDKATAYSKERDKTTKAKMLNEMKIEAKKLGVQVDAAKGYAQIMSEAGNKMQKRETETNQTEVKNFSAEDYSDKTRAVVDRFIDPENVAIPEQLPNIVGTDGKSLSMPQKKALLQALREGKTTMAVKALYDGLERMMESGYIEIKDTITGETVDVPYDNYMAGFSGEEATDQAIEQEAEAVGWKPFMESAFDDINDTQYESSNEEVSGEDANVDSGTAIEGPQTDTGANRNAPTIEQRNVQAQLDEAESELSAARSAFDQKRSELDKGLIADQEDLFGDRKSSQGNALFDERVDPAARDKALKPYKERVEKAKAEYDRLSKKLQGLEDKPSAQMDMGGALPKLGPVSESSSRVEMTPDEMADPQKTLDAISKFFESSPSVQRAIEFVRSIVSKNKNIKLDATVRNFYAGEYTDSTGRVHKLDPSALGYSFGDGTFIINFDKLAGNPDMLYSTYLHEMAHAATRYEINNNSAFREELNEALAILRDHFKVPNDGNLVNALYALGLIDKDLYGMANEHELIAELFSNKSFYEMLKMVPKGKESLLTWIFRKIASWFSSKYKMLAGERKAITDKNMADYLMSLTERVVGASQKFNANDNTAFASQRLYKEKMSFRDLFRKRMNREKVTGKTIAELQKQAIDYFKANGIPMTHKRVVGVMNQITRLTDLRNSQQMLESVLEAIDTIVLQQQNQDNLKEAKLALKKIKKVARGSNIQEVDMNFLKGLNFPNALKVLRMLGPDKLVEYVNIIKAVANAYSTKQGIREIPKDRVRWFIDKLSEELGGKEQERAERLLQMAKDAGEVAQDTTLEQFLPVLYGEDQESGGENFSDYLKSVVKDLQAALGDDYGENTYVARQLKELDISEMDNDGLKKLNNILNNILNDEDFDGSEGLLAKYSDAAATNKELSDPANNLKVKELNAGDAFLSGKVAELKTFTNTISALFFNDKTRAKFRALLFGKLDQSLSKARSVVDQTTKEISDIYKKHKLKMASDFRLSVYAFLNQHLGDPGEQFDARLDKLIADGVENLYYQGALRGNTSSKKKLFTQHAVATAEALKSMGLIEGYRMEGNFLFVDRKQGVTFDDLQGKLNTGEQAAYNYARQKFDEMVDSLERAARNVYGKDFTRWENYFPMIAKKMTDEDRASDADSVTDSLEIMGELPNRVSKKPSDRLKERGELAGSGKYYQMGFMDNFLNTYNQGVITVTSGRNLVALATVANGSKFGKFLTGAGNEALTGVPANFQENKTIFRKKLAEVVNDMLEAPFQYRSAQDFKRKLARGVMNWVVRTWLSRVDQLGLQYLPNLGATLVETDAAGIQAVGLQFKAVYDKEFRKDYVQFLSNFSGQFRASMGMEAFDEQLDRFDDPKFFHHAGHVLDVFNKPGTAALKIADRGANNLTIIAAYIKYMVDNGLLKSPGDFDMATEAANPNQEAMAYAENLASRVNNESDRAKRAGVIKNKSGNPFTFMWLLKGYNLNAYQEASNNIRIAFGNRSMVTTAERAEALRHALGYLSQIVTFNTLKLVLTGYVYSAAAQAILPAMLGIEPTEEDDDKKKAQREKRLAKYAANILADAALGGVPSIIEDASKQGLNSAFKQVVAKLKDENDKDGVADPRFDFYYTGDGASVGGLLLITDAVKKIRDGINQEENKLYSDEVNAAKDKVDYAQLAALALRSGDLLRISGAVDQELNKLKIEKRGSLKPRMPKKPVVPKPRIRW